MFCCAAVTRKRDYLNVWFQNAIVIWIKSVLYDKSLLDNFLKSINTFQNSSGPPPLSFILDTWTKSMKVEAVLQAKKKK